MKSNIREEEKEMVQAEVKKVRVYVIEEQTIYQEVYRIVFSPDIIGFLPAGISYPIELLGISSDFELEAINRAIINDEPDVMLLSTRKITPDMVITLENIRRNHPGIGIALLLMYYSPEDIELLRRVVQQGEGGMALFLKQSVDLSEQMCSIIIAVRQGQVILDPALSTLLFTGKPECPVLKQLTARELEILSLLSKGHTNGAIAQSLYIDIKTVEHHINSMYSKLKTTLDFNSKHSRVSAARLYLEATGELLTPVLAD
ncbi:MAG: response regulator transcription factor [Dehalococcoidales bacterium]|jgi:DNA-binding NarL/FixJ family response regulator